MPDALVYRDSILAGQHIAGRLSGQRSARALSKRQRPNLLLADSQLPDQVFTHLVAPPNALRNNDFTLARDRYLRLDDVFLPVTLRSGNIARQLEVFERRERNIVRAPDAGFEHTPAPYRNAPFLRRIVNRDGLAEAADAAVLDVDDAAGFHFDCGQRVAAVADRLIETDGRTNPLLQHRVEVEVIRPKWLLNHQQIETIEVHLLLDLIHTVGGIRIHAQQDIR